MPHRIRPAVRTLLVLVIALWASTSLAARAARAQSAENPRQAGIDLSAAALFLEDLPPGFRSLPPADLERLDSALDIYRGMMSGQTEAGILNVTGFRADDAANRQIVIGSLIAPLSPFEQTQLDRALGNPESLIRQLKEQLGSEETGQLPGYLDIGATGVAFTTTTASYRLNYVVARRGPVVIEVVCLFDADQAPLADVVALARLLDQRVSAVVGPETLRFRTAGPVIPELTT